MTDATNPSAKTGEPSWETAVLELKDKLWIARCNSGDKAFRECAERAIQMADEADWSPLYTHPQPSLSVGLDREARERLEADARMLTDNYSAGDDRHRMGSDLRSLLALAAPAEGWQPIETAPKDGTQIMIWTTIYGSRVVLVTWTDDKYAKNPIPRWEARDPVYGRRSFVDAPPTHWMPLPAAPTGGRK